MCHRCFIFQKKKDIFSKYTETGAKAGLETSPKIDKSLPEISKINGNNSNGKQNVTNGRIQFPDIKHNGDIIGDDLDGACSPDSLIHDSENETTQSQNSKDEVFDLTRLKTKYAEQSFRHMDVSPIQTPHVQRPMTREQTRLSFGDKIQRILNGEVHVSCPTINKSIKLYLCSGFSGKLLLNLFYLYHMQMNTICLVSKINILCYFNIRLTYY